MNFDLSTYLLLDDKYQPHTFLHEKRIPEPTRPNYSCRPKVHDDCNDLALFLQQSSKALYIASLMPSNRRGRAGSLPLVKKRKKLVTFADDHGEILTTVHTFPKMGELENNMCNTTTDLIELEDYAMDIDNYRCTKAPLRHNKSFTEDKPTDRRSLTMNHNLRRSRSAYCEKVQQDSVALESLYLQGNHSLCGSIGVANRTFEKKVFVRYTVDNWQSHNDLTADYLGPDVDQGSVSIDKFVFRIPVCDDAASDSSSIHFSVCLVTDGTEYWDNHNEENYLVSLKAEEDDSCNTQHTRGII